MSRTALSLVTAASLLMGSPAGASGAWSRVSLAPRALGLTDVVAIAADDAWAVGQDGLASHWDGTSWSSRHLGGMRPPILTGVDAVSGSDVWAVGRVISFDVFRAFIAHWDGSSWIRFPAAEPPGEVFLEDVAVRSASDAWIVGRWVRVGPTGAPAGPVILHWDGSAWRRAGPPSGVTLTAATVLAGGDLLAVGRSTATKGPVAVRGRAGSWRIVRLPGGGGRCVPRDVTTSPHVVVGTCANPGGGAAPYVAERRNGVWTHIPVTASAGLWGVDGGPITWAVGRSSPTGQPRALRRRADETWRRVATPSLPRGGLLMAVDVRTFGDAWAVGWRRQSDARRPLAMRWNGASWALVGVPTS